MDAAQVKQLILAASSRGLVAEEALAGIHDRDAVVSRRVPTSNLLSTYSRRLRRTGRDADLLNQTEKLVELLRRYPGDEIAMISVYLGNGGSRLLLANSDESESSFG